MTKRLFLIILTVFLALTVFSQQEIRDEIDLANSELIEIYGFQVNYSLTILKGEGHEQPAAIDSNGSYMIFLYTANYKKGVARHELAHVYFFEFLRRKGSTPREFPIWYHELMAEGFQNLHLRLRWPSLRAGFYVFTGYDDRYPEKESQGIFYGAVSGFAGFLVSRGGYGKLLEVAEEYLLSKDMESSFRKVYGSGLNSLVLKWRVVFLIPYSPFLIGLVLFLYLLIGRRERYWRQFPLNQENLSGDIERENDRVL